MNNIPTPDQYNGPLYGNQNNHYGQQYNNQPGYYHQNNYNQQFAPPLKPRAKQIKKGNALGVWGLVLSICTYVFSLIGIGILFWPFGLTLSIIGLNRQPKTSALIGLILSVIYLLIIVAIIAFIFMVGVPALAAALPFLALFIDAFVAIFPFLLIDDIYNDGYQLLMNLPIFF